MKFNGLNHPHQMLGKSLLHYLMHHFLLKSKLLIIIIDNDYGYFLTIKTKAYLYTEHRLRKNQN